MLREKSSTAIPAKDETEPGSWCPALQPFAGHETATENTVQVSVSSKPSQPPRAAHYLHTQKGDGVHAHLSTL